MWHRQNNAKCFCLLELHTINLITQTISWFQLDVSELVYMRMLIVKSEIFFFQKAKQWTWAAQVPGTGLMQKSPAGKMHIFCLLKYISLDSITQLTAIVQSKKVNLSTGLAFIHFSPQPNSNAKSLVDTGVSLTVTIIFICLFCLHY